MDEVRKLEKIMPYYRRNLIVLCLAIFLAGVSWNQVIPFLPLFIKDELGVKKHLYIWITAAYGAQSLAAVVFMPFWGKMGDRHGRKRMIVRAGICLTAIYFGTSICTNVLQLTIMRFLNGALTGFVPGSFALIATNTPQEHAPRSVAWAETASYAGLIFGPGLGGLLAVHWSFRNSLRLSGVIVMLTTLFVLWLVQEPNKSYKIEKTSLVEDFLKSINSKVQLSLMIALAVFCGFSGAINPYLSIHLSGLHGFLPHGVPIKTLCGFIFSLPAIAFVLVARRWTAIGERRGYHRNIFLGLMGGAIGAACLIFAHNVWAFASVYFITGIFLAAISPAVGAITCTRVDEGFRGRAYGIQQSAGTVGGMLAPLISGPLLAPFGIQYVFAFVSIFFLTGALAFRRLAVGWVPVLSTKPAKLPEPASDDTVASADSPLSS